MIRTHAVAAHLWRCMALEMALPFRRIMRFAVEPYLRFCSAYVMRPQVEENSMFLRGTCRSTFTPAFARLMPTVISLLWGMGTALSAADVVERPLYVAGEILPSTFRSTVNSNNGTFHGEDTAANLGLAAGIRWSFAPAGWSQGPVLGVEGAVEQARFDTGSHQAAEVRAVGAWAIAINHQWLVQAGVRAGYGISQLHLGVTGGSDVSTGGIGRSIEPSIEAVWSVSERGRLLLGVGWRNSIYDYSSNGVDITLLNRGLTARFGFEWQFSVAPARLQ
jgi:hypothetical protein